MAKINANYELLAAGYLFPEIARRARAFVAANPGVELLRLGIGDTTEPLTPLVIDGLRQGVERLAKRESYSGYGESEGTNELRTAIAKHYARRGVELGLDEIFVSDGAKPDSGNIQSIFAADAVVAVQDPAYPVYVDTNVIAGRAGTFESALGQYSRLVYMPCDESNGFFPALPSGKVDLLYLCSPNNPTGAVATREQLEGFVRYAQANRAVIIYDAAYADFIRSPELPRSIYEIEGAKECAIELYSLSKGAGFTGVRLGWAIVPTSLRVEGDDAGRVNQLWRRRQNTFFNGASNVVQAGAVAALSEAGYAECQRVVDYYMHNAQLVRRTLTELGLVAYGGDNGPYVWMKTPNGMKSWDFFDKLLSECHVVGTPGAGFGPSGEGYFRLSAFGHREDIERAVTAIRQRLVL